MFDAAVEKRTGLIGNFLQADGTDDFIHFHRFYSMTSSMVFYRRRRRRRRRGRSRDSFVRRRCHLVVTSSSSHVLSCVFVCVFVFFPRKRENSTFPRNACFLCRHKKKRSQKHPEDLRKMSSEYPTEEERERLRNALALLENKPPLPLWRLFREASLSGGACRDIVEKHVMCKLNRTDLKFFYEVNTETRELIKRSSRKGELKETFKVEEMSSISTLEIAWENKSLWSGYLWNETWFCRQVAETNKLELLKWAREEKECEWDEYTINVAASQGNLEMLKYCVANECPIYAWACTQAAQNGHLACLKYLHEEVKAPWDYWSVYHAHKNNQTECVQYLLGNNCPLPPGWRYEHGVLHAQ